MAVVKSVIKAELNALYSLCSTGDGIDADTFADGMADIIRNAILSATVTVQPGITLTTPDTINGSTTGTGTTTVS